MDVFLDDVVKAEPYCLRPPPQPESLKQLAYVVLHRLMFG